MAQSFRSLYTSQSFINLINQEGAFLNAAGVGVTSAGAAYFPYVSNTVVENTQIEVLNQLILRNNVGETDTANLFAIATNTQLFVAQQNDAIPLWENIADNVFSIAAQMAGVGGAVDLSTTESYLQLINDKVGTIAQSVGGGAPLSFADIVAALNSGFFSVADEIFSNSQLAHFDLTQLVNAVGQVGAGGGAEILKDDLARIPVLLAQLISTIQLIGGQGDPATQKIADNTEIASLDDPLLKSILDSFGSADIDEYHDYIATSGPLGVIALGAQLWPVLLRALQVAKGVGKTAAFAAVGDIAFNQGRLTLDTVDPAMHWFKKGLESILPIVGKVVSTGLDVAEAASEPLTKFFEPVFHKLLAGVKDSVQAAGEIGPAGGFKAAEQFLSKAALNGMHAHHLAEIIEMMPHVKHFGMNMLPAFMADMAGFGAIASQTWGRAVGEGVGRAAGYEINASMRSRLPDPRMLEQMVFEGQLSEADQAALLAFSGYNDDYIARMQKIQYVEPNLRQLSGLAADASMPEAKTEGWLREIGFSADDAAQLLPIIMQQSMKAQRGSLETEVMNNLRSGLLSEADADFYFDKLRLHPLARDMLLTSARLGLRRNSIEDNIATYRQLYLDGLLDDSDFRLGLQSQGVTDARLEVELSQVANKRFAKVAETEAAETKAEIRKQQGLLISAMRAAFQHGFIDASQFQQTLEHSGITTSVAAATVELESIKLEGRALTSRSAEAARIMQREIRIREDTFVELFRKGAINNLQLQQSLLGSGLPEQVVEAIVERELARIRPTPEDLLKTPGALKAKELFTLAKAKLQVQFAKAAIDADAYLTQLVALGMDQDIARATVALDVARRSGEKQPPASAKVSDASLADLRKKVDDALQKFAETNQTSAALEDVLSRLGIVEEVLDALVALANEQQEALAAQETAVS